MTLTTAERAAMIVHQCDGIDPPFEAFYIQSIIYAADRSVAAFEAFDRAATQSVPSDLVFAMIQEALTHAGALSRFFWPVKKGDPLAAARGAKLRKAFNLDDSSPLRSRTLRNAFEHFDEDLDRFLLRDLAGYLFPSPLVEDHTLADEAAGHIFKLVDPRHGVCVLLGEKFEFRPIRYEVQNVLLQALEMDSGGARLHDIR